MEAVRGWVWIFSGIAQCTLPEQNSKIAVMENSTESVMLATTKATFSFLSFTIAGITDKYLNFSVFL